MPSLLIRDVSEQTKRALAIRAAEHGRSQQAEARHIIEDTLTPKPQSWVSLFREGAQSVGGIEIPEPQRHIPRLTGIEL